MVTSELFQLLLLVSFNYNLYQLSRETAAITRHDYRFKRYVDYLIVGWGGRLVAAGLICLAYHFWISDLTVERPKGGLILVAVIATLNGLWTGYEFRRNRNKYRRQGGWMEHGKLF